MTGFGHSISFINIDRLKVPYSFSIKLLDRTYRFIIKYNDTARIYTADLYDSRGKALAYGEPILYGKALFSVVETSDFPIPVIIPCSVTADIPDEINHDNFGDAVRLYLYDRV